eukprot:comp12622_c0_seq1/m.7661 comp12622_c0_seq1/g.7661  ORF comp12622_c0_seq1/g.7661 comp12622_c0_seq1/m.7661 type:complete len:605 (-) comp12622_c0_seq1:275-2089(-)
MPGGLRPTKSTDAIGTEDPSAESKARFEQFKRDHPDWYYVVPENPTIGERIVRPYHLTRMYWRRVQDQFGWRFVLLLCSTYFGIKGFLYALLGTAQLPYFLYLMGLESTDYQIYSTIARTPWSMKAVMGMMSDLLPIRGYLKKYYLLMFALFGAICYIVVGFWTISPELGYISAILFFLCNYQIALSDLLVEGRYAELMVKNPETSSDIVTIVWATYFVGGLLAVWIVGPLSDKYDETSNPWYIKGMFLAGAPFCLQLAIPVALNYLGELPLPMHMRGFQRSKWNKHTKVFILALIMGALAVGSAVVGLLNKLVLNKNLPTQHKQLPIFLYSLLSSILLVAASYYYLPRGVANAMTYMFYTHAAYLGIGGLMDVFFVGSEDCMKDAPHFNKAFYITWSGTIGNIMGLVGVTLFQAIMSEWEFRPCFWVTTALQCAAAIFDIILVKRWNISWGISDHWMYMLGDNIIATIVGMLNFMPGVVLISKLCPKGMESTLYALLAGFSNFGNQVASYLGVYAAVIFNVSMKYNGPCTGTENLGWLIAVTHIFIPLTCIPATFLLIPKARLTDPLFQDEFHAPIEAANEEEEINNHVTLETANNVTGEKKV